MLHGKEAYYRSYNGALTLGWSSQEKRGYTKVWHNSVWVTLYVNYEEADSFAEKLEEIEQKSEHLLLADLV